MKIFVTGGSGVLGDAFLKALDGHGHEIVALSRRRPVQGAGTVVQGDLTRPGLGLSEADRRLAEQDLDCIVHTAAVVDFSAPRQVLHDTNVTGTSHVVELARRTGARLVHVSTAFVDLTPPPDVTGGDATMRPGEYLAAKRAGEAVVRTSGVRHAIVRPSAIAGDAETGEIPEMQGLHSIGKAVVTGSIPLVLCAEDALYDLVPRDLAGAALAAVVHDPGIDGTCWLTAGPAALPAQRLLDLAVETGRRHGLSVEPVRRADPEMFERLIKPAFYDTLDPRSRRKFANLMATLATLFQPHPMPTSFGVLPGLPPALTTAQTETIIANSVGYALRAHGLANQEVA